MHHISMKHNAQKKTVNLYDMYKIDFEYQSPGGELHKNPPIIKNLAPIFFLKRKLKYSK